MATNLAIDPKLIELALEVSGERSKKAAVTMALQEFVARRRQKRLLELMGKLEWDRTYDYKTERTRDHSYVESLVDAGVIREDQARGHPERSVLLSALGKQDDELELSASRSSRIVAGGDVFLLCSDGVWEHLTDQLLEQLLGQASSAQQWKIWMVEWFFPWAAPSWDHKSSRNH